MIAAAVILSILLYLYYDNVESFFLEADPIYRGLAMFTLCFLGASSIIVPIPYTAAIMILSAEIPGLNLLELAFWGGLGSGLGEILGWLLGRYLKRGLQTSRYGARLRVLSNLLKSSRANWLIPLLILLFSYTFLPDDALFIILGAVEYSVAKALAFGILGKASMLYTVGWFGRLVGDVSSTLPNWVSIAITLLIIVFFLALIEIIDWEALAEKYLSGQ